MNKGSVEQIDEPSRISLSALAFVADFIGHCNVLSGRVLDNREGIVGIDMEGLGPVKVTTASGCRSGDQATIALRPEKIRIRKPDTPDRRQSFRRQRAGHALHGRRDHLHGSHRRGREDRNAAGEFVPDVRVSSRSATASKSAERERRALPRKLGDGAAGRRQGVEMAGQRPAAST